MLRKALISIGLLLYSFCLNAENRSDSLSVMTFNIRYGTAPDGEHRWERRQELVFELFERYTPQLIGLQEALDFQIEALLERFPHYRSLGVGRDDGKRKGEFSPILYDSRRFAVDQWGTFWFSETPELPGSKSWGNEIPRICTWARFFDRVTGDTLFVYNLHLDHQSQISREKSVELLLKKMRAAVGGLPIILLGDFNAGEENPAIQAVLTAPGLSEERPMLRNAFRLVHPDEQQVGTFHGFSDQAGEEMIDHIFVSAHFSVAEANILREHPDGRYPSDHYPVWAKILSRK